ncbi:HAD-IB family phosphatase [bacterium]|nr:HAD-IB family phosphatase [bacterium]
MNSSILFADIDGTLVLRSLERWLLYFMRHEGLLSYFRIIQSSIYHILKNPFTKWYEWKLVYLQGKSEREVNHWIETCWERYIQPALITESIQLLELLRRQDVRIVLLSGTPRSLAKPLMAHLNIHDIICAEPVVENDRYSGGVHRQHPRGMAKVHYIEEWLEAHKQSWKHTIAMADHWHDRHLLSRVKVPVAVHPGPKLARLARKKSWQILASTSDVENIYYQIIDRIE